MTETTNPGPDQPGGLTSSGGGGLPASSAGQELLDGGALEADGSQWGPTRPPKTDAADDSAEQQDPRTYQEGSVAGEGDPLAPQSQQEPYVTSGGRGNAASGGAGLGSSPGRGDAASTPL